MRFVPVTSASVQVLRNVRRPSGHGFNYPWNSLSAGVLEQILADAEGPQHYCVPPSTTVRAKSSRVISLDF